MTNKEWETSPIAPDTQSKGSRKIPGRQSVVFLVRSDVKKELERGKRKFEAGDTEGARLAYERALDLDPGCAIAYFYLGFTYHEMGNLEAAKEYYLQAIDLERKQSLFLEHLARLHFETEEYSVCLVRFQEAQAVGPLQPISYGLMGRAHFELDRYPESIACLERMLELEEEPRLRRIAMYYLILAHLKDGSMIPARRRAFELLDDSHADPLILSALADRFQAAGCLSLALTFLERMEEESEGLGERIEEIQTLLSKTEPRLHNLFTSDEEKLLHHLHVVSQVGGDRIYRVLMSLMETPSPLVREAVVSYCRKFGYEVGEPILGACLNGEPLLREAAASPEVRREVPVTLRQDGAGQAGPSRLLEGVVDLAFREVAGAGWRVVDFKTDSGEGDALEAYRAQVRLYLEAVARSTGRPARGTLLFL
jgi:tetratricopeptide (TPR) repeat protein